MNPSTYQTFALLALLPILLLAYLFGGSSTEGLQMRLITNGLSAIIFAVLLIIAPHSRIIAFPTPLGIFFLVLFTILFLQCVPLPAPIWTALPGRETVVAELTYLGRDLPWLPLSLVPRNTFITMTELLPAILAGFVAATLDQKPFVWLLTVICLVSLISAFWGFSYVLMPSSFGENLWAINSGRKPSGAYANINHQASHMLISIPILAICVLYFKRNSRLPDILINIMGLSTFLVFFMVLTAAGSVAGYLLGVIAFFGTVWIYVKETQSSSWKFKSRPIMSLIIGGCLVMITIVIYTSPQLSGLGITSFEKAPLSRLGMSELSINILSDHWLWGTGGGSFSQIYVTYEAADTVSSRYVNHAHNEYLELIIEYGVVSIALLVLVGFHAFWRGLKRHDMKSTSRRLLWLVLLLAALHSLVDYPLRSQFLLIVIVICAARLCQTGEIRSKGIDGNC